MVVLDLKAVRERVLSRRWPGIRWGDGYRSTLKQIDNVIAQMEDENSPIQWLPLDLITDDEAVTFVENILDREGGRELFSNIRTKGYKKDLQSFLIRKSEDEKKRYEWEQNMLRKDFPTLGNLKIRELIPEMRLAIRIDWFEKHKGMKKNIAHIINTSEAILYEENYITKIEWHLYVVLEFITRIMLKPILIMRMLVLARFLYLKSY